MEIIVDANIFKSYYEVTVKNKQTSLTNCPKTILEGKLDFYFDEGGHIEQEWKSPVDPYWFDQWLTSALERGVIKKIRAHNYAALCKCLYTHGLPKNSRDIWYIRTAKAFSESSRGPAFVISEDIDLFDPTQKQLSGARRIKCLKNKNARLRKFLRDNHNIHVVCIEDFLHLGEATPAS